MALWKFTSASYFASWWCDQTLTKNSLGQKGFMGHIFPHRCLSLKAKTQSGTWSRNHGGAVFEPVPHGLLSLRSYISRVIYPGWHYPLRAGPSCINHESRKCSPTGPQTISVDVIPQSGYLFPGDTSWQKLTITGLTGTMLKYICPKPSTYHKNVIWAFLLNLYVGDYFYHWTQIMF